ncbi:Dynamin-binding protein, partial [Stegodyphus mimosarum]
MDISLKKGDIVGVIKQQDPMGTRLRWFVDNGDAKGFVPAKCLVKLLPSASSPLSQGASCDWNRQNVAAATKNTTPVQIASNKTKPQALPSQNKEIGPIQPTRPAPSVSSSLRVVPPSRYPPIAQPILKQRESNSVTPTTTNNSVNIFVNKNSELDSVEPMHRYEEIPDSLGGVIERNKHSCDKDLMGSSAVTPTNILEEFDPYSSPKQPTELYDNVPDNLNCLYSTHRYEDIPDDVPYDYVPTDSQHKDANEYYFAMYDFLPTGP